MGTHAATRIANENDYIEHHTRWDGNPGDIVDNIQSMTENWKISVENMREKLETDEQGTFQLKKWVDSFEKMLNDYTLNPTIEMASMLLCFHSFVHHHVLPNKTTDDLLQYWGEGSPDVTAQLIGKEFNFTYQDYDSDDIVSHPVISVSAKQILPAFKVMRIYRVSEDGKILDNHYIDFKYKNISEEELFGAVLDLPLFMRDLYTINKMSRTEKKSLDYKVDSFVQLARKLSSFYKPTSEYVLYGREENDVIRSTDERKQSIEDTLDNAISMIPFDLDVASFGSHIALSQPGNVFPLTKAERMSDYEVSFKIALIDNRINYIYCNIPNKDEQEMLDLLNEIALHFDYRMHSFNVYHGIDKIADDIQFSRLLNDEVFLGLAYEESIVKLMENQYLIEINNLLESQE